MESTPSGIVTRPRFPAKGGAPRCAPDDRSLHPRLVYTGDAGAGPFEAMSTRLMEIAEGEGWLLDEASRAGAVSWTDREARLRVRLFEPNASTNLAVLVVAGDDATGVLERIRALGAHTEPSELARRYAREVEVDARANLLFALGYALPSQHVLEAHGAWAPEAMVRLLDGALTSSDRTTVLAALHGVALLRWWALRGRVVEIGMTLRHPCQERALHLLGAWAL